MQYLWSYVWTTTCEENAIVFNKKIPIPAKWSKGTIFIPTGSKFVPEILYQISCLYRNDTNDADGKIKQSLADHLNYGYTEPEEGSIIKKIKSGIKIVANFTIENR